MGKTAKCLQMLQELNTGRTYKISELAEILHTNPRNVIEYKEELNSLNDELDSPSGCYIISTSGKYGGYTLNGNAVIPALRLNDDEKNSLIKAYSYIKARNDFPEAPYFLNAIKKCMSRLEIEDKDSEETLVVDRYPLAMSSTEVNKRYNLLNEAIKKRLVITIDYLSNDNVVRSRNIQPYKLYMYNNQWFVLAYCELAKGYRYFKLCRIEKYKNTGKKFSRDIFFKESDYFDNFGMTRNSEDYHIKLQLFGAAAMYVKDYIYGKNQKITNGENGSTILEVDLRYKSNVVRFVMQFVGECKVIEPEWLKEDVKNTCLRIINSL